MLRVLIRLFSFPITTFVAVLIGLVARLFGAPHAFVYGVFNRWSKLQHFLLNTKIETEGDIPENGAIIMANHRSYLDVIMIPSKTPVVFVAKAGVRKWPIVGWGGDAMRTIWVDRRDPQSRRRTRFSIVDRLKENLSVIIFPEGTTHLGPELLEFKPGMFYAVAGTELEIIPVAIEYKNPNIAWVGKDYFIPHFWREFRHKELRVKVCFGKPLRGEDGEALRSEVHAWIEQTCMRYRAEFDSDEG